MVNCVHTITSQSAFLHPNRDELWSSSNGRPVTTLAILIMLSRITLCALTFSGTAPLAEGTAWRKESSGLKHGDSGLREATSDWGYCTRFYILHWFSSLTNGQPRMFQHPNRCTGQLWTLVAGIPWCRVRHVTIPNRYPYLVNLAGAANSRCGSIYTSGRAAWRRCYPEINRPSHKLECTREGNRNRVWTKVIEVFRGRSGTPQPQKARVEPQDAQPNPVSCLESDRYSSSRTEERFSDRTLTRRRRSYRCTYKIAPLIRTNCMLQIQWLAGAYCSQLVNGTQNQEKLVPACID